MSSLKQSIRTVLVDVETFLVEVLKGVKLNAGAKDHKDRLLEKVRQLLEDLPGSAGSLGGSNYSGGSHKISGGGDDGSDGSNNTAQQGSGNDSTAYNNEIPKKAVSELQNKLQSGLLDRKKKSGIKSWEQVYCVVSGNVFYFYKKQTDSKQREAFCLSGYEFRVAPNLDKDASRKDMCFEVVKAGAQTYQFRAGSQEGMEHWREAITKGIQITPDDEPGEVYDDVGQGIESDGNLPPPPPEVFDDPDDIYEECGDNSEVASPLPPLPSSKPPPPPPEPEVETEPPDDVYDACASVAELAEKPPAPPSLPPTTRRRDPPPPPQSDLPPPPPPKADLPAIPKSLPPPIPDRAPSNAEPPLPPPPVPSNPPPLPSRGGGSASRVPQLRKPFMDRDEDFENIYYGKWDCSADSHKELAFKQGDMIHVLSQDFDAESWWVGELDGKVGLVPKEYLCPAFELVP